jgi:excisionase family DNA binding protein
MEMPLEAKILIDIDTQSIIEEITRRILEGLKPILSKTQEDDMIFDVKELSIYLKVPVSWIYNKNTLKELPHFKTGKYTRFRKKDIDKWIESRSRKPIPPLKIVKK